MQLKLTLSFLLSVAFTIVTAQTSSPTTNDEFCPGVDYTFSITIPGTQPNVVVHTNNPVLVQNVYNSSTSNGVTTFNFKGRFRDENIKQVFKVDCKNSSNRDTSYFFEYKKYGLFFIQPLIVQKFSRTNLLFLHLPAR